MWFWRRNLNISWMQKSTDTSILLCELDTERQLLGKIISLKLGYFGHILRGNSCYHRRQGRREKKAWETEEELVWQHLTVRRLQLRPSQTCSLRQYCVEVLYQKECRCVRQSSEVTEEAKQARHDACSHFVLNWKQVTSLLFQNTLLLVVGLWAVPPESVKKSYTFHIFLSDLSHYRRISQLIRSPV